MPPRNVVPKPRQRPHPPLWVACSRRDTILTAAQRGLGALSFAFVEPEDAKEWVDSYYELIASDRCVPAGFAVNPERGGRAADDVPPRRGDGDRARHRRRPLLRLLARLLLRVRRAPPRPLEPLARSSRSVAPRSASRARSSPPTTGRSASGSCRRAWEACAGRSGPRTRSRDLVERYEASGVDQVIFVSQAGANRHEHICESLELFAAEVLPRFAERAAEREREKQRAPRGRDGAGAGAPRARRGRRSGLCRQARRRAGARPRGHARERAEMAPPRAGSPRRASWPRARERRPSRGWFAVAATSSFTASSTVGPGWR